MKKLLLLSTSLTACSVFAPMAFANPEDGVVSSGSASIETGVNRLDIRQSSDRAVIDWRSFNINQGEITQFHQPSSSSLTVNRIHDANPSQILGTLQANGKLVLINQSGISFGPNSVVDVNSLIATSSDLSNADAMAGNLNFQGAGQPGAEIINEGTITAQEAGLVGLVAPRVENRGVINARLGKVHLASGDRFSVDLYGDGALSIAASDAMQEQLVSSRGTINAEGGVVQITAAAGAQLVSSVVQLDGEIKTPSAVQKNGRIIISGHDDTAVTITGSMDASGASGGHISITGKNVLQQGKLTAKGSAGTGGTVDIKFKSAYLDNENSRIDTTGQGGDGGQISVKGKAGSRAFVSGTYDASSSTARGGTVQITADQGDLKLYGAKVRADGSLGGGTVHIGGEYQGSGTLEHALTTSINFSTILSADATDEGEGGQVIVWSDEETKFGGSVYARGGINGGDGGLIELSSKDTLIISGSAETVASARMEGYEAGQLLLDPKNITIATGGISGGISYFEMVDPNPDGGFFGNYNYRVLGNGNVVVGDPEDDLIASNAGAMYLFNGATGALISTINGAQVDDNVGQGDITELSNGNYVFNSPYWNNGGIVEAGAVTWGSATTGVSGIVSTANSLVGGYTNIGYFHQVIKLTNGNYLVSNTFHDTERGAVAWGNGNTGTFGVLSAANALVGTTAYDYVGSNNVVPLANGNYVVFSAYWDNGGIADVGAVTLGNGLGGTVGTISSANSLIGSTANDQIGTNFGNRNFVELSNSNFLIGSTSWDNGGAVDAGAVTFINGTTGLTGFISSANSLIGSTAGDFVGSIYTDYHFIELSNGNFVVASPNWDNGGIDAAGAVTMGSITTGISGVISAANSLVGTTASDMVGAGPGGGHGLMKLANGNFVVLSTGWDRGGIVDAGAATWVDGTAGLTGAVTDTNSLVGSLANDRVGSGWFAALSNGNYVVGSIDLDDGILEDVGAATWGNGATGISGSVTSANSILGSSSYDGVGNSIYALANGNYIMTARYWDNGLAADVGAVTWADGTTGLTGYVTAANSLIGTTPNDQVGSGGVYSVGTGNLVVVSEYWDNGAIVDSGAVTWFEESDGTSGVVSTANSLYSSTANSTIGSFAWGGSLLVLPNGNYLVRSESWDDGLATDVGAITWGNGNTGVIGAVSASNSLVGSTSGDALGSYGFQVLPNSNYIVNSAAWDNGAAVDAGAVTWGNGATGTVGVVSAQNSVVGSQSNDLVGWQDWYDSTVMSNNDYVLHALYWDNGALVDAGAVMVIDGTNGTFGEITSYNAILASVANASLWPNYQDNEDEINGRYVYTSYIEQKVYSIDLQSRELLGSYNSYSDSAGSSVTLSPDFITHTLNTGTSVTLQANNDITLNNDLIVSNNFGDGGTLTFQAGRSILLNADIVTDNGDLNLFANEDLATGVVNAHRDAGAAVITMAAGAEIDAGTGAVNIRLDDGTGKTNATAGNITLRDITAGSIFVRNMNASTNLIVQSGVLSASDAGTAITLVSGRNFINNSGAGALNASAGRWLVYSTNPASDTIGGLPNDFRRFSCTYGGACPAIPATDNGLLYSYTPTLTITPTALAAIQYGDAVPTLTGYSYGVTGYLGGDAADDALGGGINGSTTYIAGSGVGSYNLNYASGALTSDMGYGFTYANNATAITVGKKDITASFSAALSKVYGDANPTITHANFTFAGLVGSDSSSLFTSVTPNYGAVDANTGVSVGNAVTAAIGATANYNVTNTPATTLAITPRALTVTTNPDSKVLPAADPVFTGSANLTAYDAGLVSWAYAPLAYAGLEGTYTIGATATDPSSRLANYTRTNVYGNFIVYPIGTVFSQPAPDMPDTVNYMSLGGFLRDIQGESVQGDGSSAANVAPEQDGIESQLLLAETEGEAADTETQERSFINIHPRLKAFLTNPFAMLVN